jgi:hypothetical protein
MGLPRKASVTAVRKLLGGDERNARAVLDLQRLVTGTIGGFALRRLPATNDSKLARPWRSVRTPSPLLGVTRLSGSVHRGPVLVCTNCIARRRKRRFSTRMAIWHGGCFIFADLEDAR